MGNANTELLAEVHILGEELSLYGETLDIIFVARLRNERKFPNLEELKAQIQKDSRRALEILQAQILPHD
jgi:riboflavin kinase/FMN adenylyltransferase